MCGILFIYDFSGKNGVVLRRASEARTSLRHRGPDLQKTLRLAPGAILGFWRLAVRRGPQASQPQSYPDGSTLACNGEIYNADDLACCLGLAREYSQLSDTAVLYPLIARDGWEGLRRADGMYAGVVFESHTRRLFAFRDPLGIKPLYYFLQPANILVLASEIQAIALVLGSIPARDSTNVRDCLVYGQPLASHATVYSGIRQVPPGSVLCFDSSGTERVRHSFSYRDVVPPHGIANLDAALSYSVETTLDANRPPTLLLSGGIDSSLIALFASRHLNANCQALAVDYPDTEGIPLVPTELSWARHVADRLHIPLQIVRTPRRISISLLEQVFAATEQPIFTPATITSSLLASAAHQTSRPSTLSGDGCDELFLAYARIRSRPLKKALLRSTRTAEDLLLPYAKRLSPLANLNQDCRGPVLSREFSRQSSLKRWSTSVASDPGDPADILRHFELTVRLPNYHLVRVDKTFMRNSVEVRVPFLRNAVMREALARPAELLLSQPPKLEARKILASNFLASLAWRPKQKFSAPWQQWSQNIMKNPESLRYAITSECVLEFFDEAALRRILWEREVPATAQELRLLWVVICLAAWERSHQLWPTN